MTDRGASQENYIDHEVRLRIQEHLYKQISRRLNTIIALCGSIVAIVVVPIILHKFGLT